MYSPPHFSFSDHEGMLSLARQHNFATIVSFDASMPYASHVPLLVEVTQSEVVLSGHFASSNPHCELIGSGNHLAIFHGPHTYISPTWYQDPGVPTWNYLAVHMSGSACTVDDPSELAEIVEALSNLHESPNATPWKPRYAAAMLRAIRGFRIHVDRIEGKRKLSQNRSAADRQGVISALQSPFGGKPDNDQQAICQLMQEGLST